jgi:class 3 adenylate cyclase
VAYPIVVIKQPNRRALYVQLREPVEVGRECDGILVADAQTSRRHAQLTVRGNDVLVEDLGSTNGTYLDGTRVSAPVLLRPGSVVRVGDTTLELHAETGGDRSTLSPASDGRSTIVAGSAEATGSVRPAMATPSGLRETSIDVIARAVNNDQVRLQSVEHDQGTITIVFSDIESSTERATAMGDVAWMKVLAAHNEIIRRNVLDWGGSEVKNQGDGFMLTFPGARRALRSMISVQQELARYAEENPDRGVKIRIGVHTGEVILSEGDIFGKHVMLAARVGNLALGGEILVSSLVREIASARGDLVFGEPRTVTLKGIEGEHTVYPLLWEEFVPTS